MNSVRLWILLLAGVSFLAGGAGGLLIGMELPRPDPVPFAAYEAPFAEDYDLTADQRRVLRMALSEYEAGLEDLKKRGLAAHEEELIRLGRECRAHIRDWVLPPERLEEFDTKVAGLPFPPTPGS